MDTDAELLKAKWLIFGCVAFIVSGCFSWTELRYAVRGRTVDAELVGVRETRQPRGRHRTVHLWAVSYAFTDEDGTRREERDDLPIEWPRPAGETVAVEYIPGEEDASRLVGHRRTVPVVLFLGCTAWLAIAGFRLWREAREAVHGPRRRRK